MTVARGSMNQVDVNHDRLEVKSKLPEMNYDDFVRELSATETKSYGNVTVAENTKSHSHEEILKEEIHHRTKLSQNDLEFGQGWNERDNEALVAKLMAENKKLKEEMAGFDLEFFEQLEDLKYRYSR
jgi:hypothetical protein